MQINDMYLFAVNSGEFYESHIHMAKSQVPTWVWQTFIKETLLPAYRRTTKEHYDGLTLEQIEKCANSLQAYYNERIKESC